VGQGRVVYDALGHDGASLNHPTHAQLLRDAAQWALHGEHPS
jgi:type 1 glutamine amidotransferase